MWQAFLEFLKQAGDKIAKSKVGQAVKEGLKEAKDHPYKTAFKMTSAGGLADAFGSQSKKQQPISGDESNGALSSDFGSKPSIIPSNVQPLAFANQGQQGGTIPSSIMDQIQMAKANQPPVGDPNQIYGVTPMQPQGQNVGAMRGFIDALTGQPQPSGLDTATQGRKTAYYAGGLIPNIIMSKLGQPSPAEASARQSIMKLRGQTDQDVIDPDTGQVIYKRPKGSVFKPQPSVAAEKFEMEQEDMQSLKNAMGAVNSGLDPELVAKRLEEDGSPKLAQEFRKYLFMRNMGL